MSKTILITGANGGMGRVTAELAAAEGYSLLLADLPSTDLAGLASDFEARGVAVKTAPLDVLDPAAIESLVTTVNATGGVDALVHTVGVSPQMADWQRVIDIDLVATAAFLEAMRPAIRPGGAAVCFSSSSGYLCPPNEGVDRALSNPLEENVFDALEALGEHPLTHSGLAYAYAKRALQHFVAQRAGDWGAEGKRLVSLSPGLIDTDMGRLEYDNTENFAAMLERVALGELGKPEHIANVALFLVSDKAAYVTGCDFLVDGGLIAGIGT